MHKFPIASICTVRSIKRKICWIQEYSAPYKEVNMSKKSWLKILIVWVLYVLLHFTYKYFPNPVFVLFGCPEETIFQHMKMGFFSYSLVSIIEYFVLKTKIRRMFNFNLLICKVETIIYKFVIHNLLFWIIWINILILFYNILYMRYLNSRKILIMRQM